MFAHRRGYFKALWGTALLLAALLALGCGGDPSSGDEESPAATSESGGADIADADPDDVAVITEWVDTLRSGDVTGAAELFAVPSIAENGSLVLRIDSREAAVAFNRSLPCGAELLGAQTTGELTTATFRLLDRPGGDCGPGVGGEASTSFLIEDGLIVEWRRVGTDRRPEGEGGRTT